MRIKIIKISIIFSFIILALGLINLQLLQGRKLKELSKKNCIRLMPQEGCRGRILDRGGNVIVDSKLTYEVMVLPAATVELEKTLRGVSGILGISTTDLKKKYKSGYIALSVPVIIASGIEKNKAIALEEARADIPGILVQSRPQRAYPHGSLAAHLLGYVSEIDRWRLTKLADYGYNTKDIVGFGGIEEKYDYYLRQEEGGLSFEVDHQGRFTRVLGFQPPHSGKDLQLTLDLKIQKISEDALSGKTGCVVIMDPASGQIIALASSPTFNPAYFAERNPASLAYLNDADAPLLNRATSGQYPPGSVFKPIVSTAALETKKINLATVFICQGKVIVGRQEFNCWSTHGAQNIIQAIAHSCNAFFYRTGLLVGAQTIHDYAVKFGLSKNTGFELPYESSGFVPSPLWRKISKFKNWFDGDTANLSIGQGELLVTPLQMARVIAVFANGGYLVSPYVVQAIDGRQLFSGQRKAYPLSIKKQTMDYIRRGLREVITDQGGTGNALSALSIPVAGKTGTAQAPPGVAHAWFVGFFPFNNPKFAICVFLEHGGPGHYACLVAKEIIENMNTQGLI